MGGYDEGLAEDCAPAGGCGQDVGSQGVTEATSGVDCERSEDPFDPVDKGAAPRVDYSFDVHSDEDDEEEQEVVGSRVSRVLTTDVHTSILRGVSAATVLRGFGASLRKHVFRQQDYCNSVPTTRLDDFISHDWASDWLGKALALCLLYNSRPAAAASLAAAVVLAALQGGLREDLPALQDVSSVAGQRFTCLCQLICPVVFGLVFVFWQDVCTALRLRTKLLFLDKYCIDQEDAERKEDGIAGIAGFLRHTDRLVICWTPRYFTRLWCTYEVASWLHLRKPMGQVEFLPLSHAQSVVLVGALCSLGCLCYTMLGILLPQRGLAVVLPLIALAFLAGMHFLRRLAHEMRKLPEQLCKFRVERAGCFCCDNGHRMPGQPHVAMPCDREVVYETLRMWFRDAAMRESISLERSSSVHLDAFDSKIRDVFGPWVLERAGPAQLPYKYLVLAGLPWLWRGGDIVAGMPTGQPMRGAFLQFIVVALAVVPVTYTSTLGFLSWVDSRVIIPRRCILDLLITAACSTFPILVAAAMVVPMTYYNDVSSNLSFAFGALDVALVIFTFRRACWRLCRRAGCPICLPSWMAPAAERGDLVGPRALSRRTRDELAALGVVWEQPGGPELEDSDTVAPADRKGDAGDAAELPRHADDDAGQWTLSDEHLAMERSFV